MSCDPNHLEQKGGLTFVVGNFGCKKSHFKKVNLFSFKNNIQRY